MISLVSRSRCNSTSPDPYQDSPDHLLARCSRLGHDLRRVSAAGGGGRSSDWTYSKLENWKARIQKLQLLC